MAPPDLSLHTALSHLLAHLTDPLASSLPPATLTLLRSHLRSLLTLLFAPSWHPSEPSRGSAFRSLIGRQGRLPMALRQAAANAAVDLALWERSLADACDGQTEWQAWCDPGRVQWRNGGWEWEDGTWFFGGWKDLTTTLWSTANDSVPTPRVSHAVTIRSPIPATPSAADESTPMPAGAAHLLLPVRSITPPTPTRSLSPYPLHPSSSSSAAAAAAGPSAPLTSANLLALPLPPFAARPDSPSAESDLSSSTFASEAASMASQTSSSHPAIHADGRALLSANGSHPASSHGHGHHHHKRISSVGSSSSTSSSLAPPSRTASPAMTLDGTGAGGRKKPVTAYDGGKVGVLGGGVKLGGGGPAASANGLQSGPTSPRKPRTGGHYQQQQHGRSRSAHRNGGGPFGQPLFGAPPAAHGHHHQHQQGPHGPFAGVFNVGF